MRFESNSRVLFFEVISLHALFSIVHGWIGSPPSPCVAALPFTCLRLACAQPCVSVAVPGMHTFIVKSTVTNIAIYKMRNKSPQKGLNRKTSKLLL